MELLVQQVINGLALGGTYALIALGLAIVFSILGFINLAHGELLTISGYAMFLLLGSGLPFPARILVSVALAGIAALLLERTGFRPFRGSAGVTLLLTSYAISTSLQVVFLNLIDPRGRSVQVPAGLNSLLSLGPLSVGFKQALSVVVTIVMLISLTLFLSKTRMGISIRAAAQDFNVTRLMGVPANRVISVVFLISGLLAGIAGVLWVAQRSTVDPTMGFTPVLKGFVATIVGGLGSLSGAVVAGFLLGFIEIMVEAFLPPDVQVYREGVVWGLVILALLLRPQGIFGEQKE